MKRPGLSDAMRRVVDLDNLTKWPSRDVLFKARRLGLVTFTCWRDSYEVTPRGQAALAAPRVTAAELHVLEQVPPFAYFLLHCPNEMYKRLTSKGWITTEQDGDDEPMFVLTPAGLTALNNVRAAMPGEWKETV